MSETKDLWDLFYKSDQYKRWKKVIRKRDDYQCQLCHTRGNRNNKICCHHIVPKAKDLTKIFDVDNGVVLCTKCHIQEHKRMHATGEDLYGFPSATAAELKEIAEGFTFKILEANRRAAAKRRAKRKAKLKYKNKNGRNKG